MTNLFKCSLWSGNEKGSLREEQDREAAETFCLNRTFWEHAQTVADIRINFIVNAQTRVEINSIPRYTKIYSADNQYLLHANEQLSH